MTNEQSRANRIAWNYRAYEFWNVCHGSAKEYAARLVQNPANAFDPRYVDLLGNLKGKRILNALGSNGRKAVPLALLGAEVTVIDISEENRKYAQELADAACVQIEYIVADFADNWDNKYLAHFDIVFCEGGILHYFNKLKAFFAKLQISLTRGGRMILNDFHPFRKILFPEIGTGGDYFNEGLHEGPVAYEDHFPESERGSFPKCLLRFFTMGDIVTAIARNGFYIRELRELKKPGAESLPGEFTIVADKI